MSELYHYGVKGMKWGQRRYQNKDGTLTQAGKQHAREQRNISRNKPHTNDINEIVGTLSSKVKELLGAPKKGSWIDKKYEKDTLKEKAASFVAKEGDTPVSFVEVWTNGGRTGQIALATRNDPKYRGKGYASKNVEAAIKWCDRYGKQSIDELEWIADRRNTASINLGKKYGFKEDDPNKHGHNWKDDWSEEYAIMYRPVKHSYICHYGTKGMKWGTRKYQTSNGTWTELGLERRRKGIAAYGHKSKIDTKNAKRLPNYKGKAYFISEKKLDGEVLKPRVPDNFFTKNGYEDKTSPRISFAPSVGKCLAGLSQNVEGKTYYVYSPEDISKCQVYKPKTKAVPDSAITDELWVANPTKVKQVAKIQVTGNEGKAGKTFSYGDKTATLYDDWVYKKI